MCIELLWCFIPDRITPNLNSTQATQGTTGDTADFTGDFGNISLAQVSSTDELEEYLRQPNESVKDPLRWWNDNKTKYPNLHRMALDYLSVPATSTAVERVFSQGRQLLNFTRSRLTGRSVRAFLCLGSWSRHDLITSADVIAAIRPKKRKRGGSESAEP